ncbi:cytochrome P450 [Artomyces pyxidatus]|uniref:Cytochrome P450 n=1 Tax=Artomyces pyxidatus TaxID=48021 RepID=A0ACB8SZR4_9AGAM|nr:cytochrome P450 [Artomyces pyxidatus]
MMTLLAALWITVKVGLSLCIVTVLTFLARRTIKQSSLRKLYGPPSPSFFSGNYDELFSPFAAPFHQHILRTYGRVMRISGFFGDAQLVICDPKALSAILVQHQDVFEPPEWHVESNHHLWGNGLFATTGAYHRKQRKLLSPCFSPKTVRSLCPLLQRATNQARDGMLAEVKDGPREIDVYSWTSRLALELVSQGGMGHTFGSFRPNAASNEVSRAIKEYNPVLSRFMLPRMYFHHIAKLPPPLLHFVARHIPMARFRRLMQISNLVRTDARNVLDKKRALLDRGSEAFTSQVSEGKDIISVLMRENQKQPESNRIPDNETVAQMCMLVFSSTDSVSSTLARTLHLLALRPDVQERLRSEINEGYTSKLLETETELGYDQLMELPYLDAVCRETLRVYPPAQLFLRRCRSDISVPLSRPTKTTDGEITSVFVPKGTTVILPALGVNRDPEIWGADAMEWKPERWLAPLPESVTKAGVPGVYSNTLTFLAGPRSCIGLKYAELEMKAVLSQFVRQFRFSPSKKEVFWRYGGITVPSIKDSPDVGSRLPMVLERI